MFRIVRASEVQRTSEDKVLFPRDSVTKGDLIRYYEEVAATIVPHLEDRPLTLQRFPNGIDAEGFFQKQVPDHFPDWISTVEVDLRDGGRQRQPLCNDAATLVYLINQGTITLHTWSSRRGRLGRPDRMIFDIDPPDDEFDRVRSAARHVKELLDELDLPALLTTTGSSGVHVVVPLREVNAYDDVRTFARGAADLLATRHPERLTTEQRKDRREGRVFIDTLRNAAGQTTVVPYSVRARDGAPVATPIEWNELGRSGMNARRYDVHAVRRRLAQRDDPWKQLRRHACSLDRSRELLGGLQR